MPRATKPFEGLCWGRTEVQRFEARLKLYWGHQPEAARPRSSLAVARAGPKSRPTPPNTLILTSARLVPPPPPVASPSGLRAQPVRSYCACAIHGPDGSLRKSCPQFVGRLKPPVLTPCREDA